MTTLAEVQAAELEEENARLAMNNYAIVIFIDLVLTSAEQTRYLELSAEWATAKANASACRAAYTEIISHTEAVNSFDLDSAEAFYESNSVGKIKNDGKLNKVSLTSISSPSLASSFFNTHEGNRYYWTTGNTYTFGGGSDYAFANSYEVTFSYDAIDKASFDCWDGHLPYDIYGPNKDKEIELNVSGRATNFDNLPKAYQVGTFLPPGPIFFRSPDDEVDFANNAVSKNIGHTYDYQLGDTYSIQLSKNTNAITSIDTEHNFESIDISENHSHVGLKADFNAHGLDVELAIKGADIAFNVKGIDLESTHALVGLSYSNKLVDISYEQAKYSFELIDRPQFQVSDENIQNLTSQRIETVAGKGIVFQVDDHAELNAAPGKILGSGSGDAIADMIPFIAWGRSVFGSSSDAKIEMIDVLDKTDVNSDRKDEVPSSASPGYSRLDIDSDAISLVSFLDKANPAAIAGKAGKRGSYSKLFWTNTESERKISGRLKGEGASIAEFVLNSRMRKAELNIRGSKESVKSKKDNFTQIHDLASGSFSTTYYEDDKKFLGKLWFSYKGNADHTITANTAGLELQKTADTSAQLKLNTALSSVVLESKKDGIKEYARLSLANQADSTASPALAASTVLLESYKSTALYVKQELNSATKKYLVQINADNAKFEMIEDKATLSVQAAATKLELEKKTATLTAETTTITADKLFTAKSKKVDLKSSDIKVGKMAVTDTKLTIPQATITMGGACKIAIKPSGITASGTKFDIKTSAMVQVTSALIKLG